jgi:hypothetical protein
MSPAMRVSAAAVTAVIAIGSAGAPAMAATSTHWSKTQCQSWQKSFLKRNPHASKARKAEGNKVLAKKNCTQRIK